ncbi:hypothetical protein UlMin_005013 [Ulmus minor]
MEISNPKLPLLGSADKTIPVFGFGTATFPFVPFETTKEAILHAIELGYGHFDSATIYQTEQPLGQAISEAISLRFIKSREELFITSKLWCCDAHPELVLPAIQKSLKNLNLEYIDLYLIHWPVALKPGKNYPFDKEQDLLPLDFQSVWEAMEECQKLGLVKSIGVSNFSRKKLETLLATAKILLAINQVEMNPIWQQKKLREFCKEKGIVVAAYSLLGARGVFWGTNRVMECEVLKEIADEKGKTIAQVCLRWAFEQGVSFVAKSFNKERMKENLGIFDWKLSPDELQKIDKIQRGYFALEVTANAAPYKTPQELWDGEI